MTDFGEESIDIEAMIEEMAEDALYRLDQRVKEGNQKQLREMISWCLRNSQFRPIMTNFSGVYERQRQLRERWLREKDKKDINWAFPGSKRHG